MIECFDAGCIAMLTEFAILKQSWEAEECIGGDGWELLYALVDFLLWSVHVNGRGHVYWPRVYAKYEMLNPL